ncbi:uncharacterized protein LOC117606705 isoform X1 [Osmia lignaria lignaria]|uniref:uncharacterized protein LOC117606705 isoform X1 n=1 Tax=Osmia lignaria lignaria TaxID=1437193 RepID=UPI0014796E06|nr:cuticle protein 18.7-like isoform X1 [Osmia lignaria]
MGPVVLLLAGLISGALAKPGILSGQLIATLTPGASIGADGRVLDTQEVAVARAEHAAAHINERLKLADEAARSSDGNLALVKQSSLLLASPRILVPGAPIGPDGRVLDTPEVAVARAAHAAAQVNERINLANEAARSAAADLNRHTFRQVVPVVTNGILIRGATIGPDGRVQDTQEVAAARAAHAAAQINERINLANEAVRSGAIVTGPSLAVPLVVPRAPIGPDGRVQDTPEVAVAKAAHATAHLNEKLNLATESAKSADVLAVAGPAFAYGRLVY